jgi:hypothetical protein
VKQNGYYFLLLVIIHSGHYRQIITCQNLIASDYRDVIGYFANRYRKFDHIIGLTEGRDKRSYQASTTSGNHTVSDCFTQFAFDQAREYSGTKYNYSGVFDTFIHIRQEVFAFPTAPIRRRLDLRRLVLRLRLAIFLFLYWFVTSLP